MISLCFLLHFVDKNGRLNGSRTFFSPIGNWGGGGGGGVEAAVEGSF